MTLTTHLRRAHCALLVPIGLALALCTPAQAQQTTVFDQLHTIAAPTTAVPVEETFTVTTAGTYTITLTDLGAALTPPAALTSVKLAVTNSKDTLVGGVLTGAGTLTLVALPADTYVLHVVGMPGNTPGSGSIGIQVNGPGSTQLAAFQATLALPAQPLPNGEGVLDDSFNNVSATGTYTVTLTDLKLPQALATVTLLLVPQSGTTPLAILPVPGTGALQANVSLAPGTTYDIFAVGAPGTAGGGLYSVVVTDGGGNVIYGRAIAAGSVNHVASAVLTAGSATLAVTDLDYPAALSQLEAAVTLTGQSAVQLSTGGQQSFTAVSGTYEVFTYGAAAAAAPAAGSYAVQLTQGASAPLSTAVGVTAAGGTESAYTFNTAIPSAGSYTLSLVDFQFPTVLSTLSLELVQGGALLGTPLIGSGNASVTAAAGPISLVAFAQPAAAAGLFGAELTPAAGGASLFETTQAAGALFSSQQVAITAPGSYAVTATDLGFPAAFANYDTIVTQGTTQLGSIFGGGTFSFTATPGIYHVNFIAQPTGSDLAGTYALTVATAPPPPTVSLTVDNPKVVSGSTVDLVWSSQNATTCTASSTGGWNGNVPLNGTATSAALTVSTTFTLSCTGAGGTTPESVTVTVTQASGHSGGGSLDPVLLLALGALLVAAVHRRRAALPS